MGKPVYSLKQIETALTTSWLPFDDGKPDTKPHTWYDQGDDPSLLGTVPLGSKPADFLAYDC